MVDETICLQCGDRGYENALVYCIRCLKFAVHRYCLDEIPESFDEFVSWLCDYCEVKVQKQSALFEHVATSCQIRHREVSGNTDSFSKNEEMNNGLAVVEVNGHVGTDASGQTDSVEYGESTSQHIPIELVRETDENAILLPVDASKISQLSSSLHQLDEEKAEGNQKGSIQLSSGCLEQKKRFKIKLKRKRFVTESTTEKDQHRSATTSYGELVKVDINKCTGLASDSTVALKVKGNEYSERKDEEKRKIRNMKSMKRAVKGMTKKDVVESTAKRDQHGLAAECYEERATVDINECSRLASDLTLARKVNECSEQKDQEKKEIKNLKNGNKKRLKKRSIVEVTAEKDQHGFATACHEVDINECSRLASDSTLALIVKENECSEQKDQEKTEIKIKHLKKRKRKKSVEESTAKKDQDILVKVDSNGCTKLASDSILASKVKENECSEQKNQICISEPFDSITDLVIKVAPADHPVISSDGLSKSSQKKKTITSSETISRKQVSQTGVAQPLDTDKPLYLRNEPADLSTKEMDFCSSNDPIEIKGSEDKVEQTSTSGQGISVAQPIVKPIWRGSFKIWNNKYGTIDKLTAHISNKACYKVYEAASQLQPVLRLEMLPKSDIWPKSFLRAEPCGDNIALYFFPSKKSKQVFEQLVEEMIQKELACKALVQNAELLIFTSTELPIRYWRFHNKFYLWGVFRGGQANPRSSLGEVRKFH